MTQANKIDLRVKTTSFDRRDSSQLNVGLIGLGELGAQIAENLIMRGHKVTGYRRRSLDSFVALGGIPAASIGELVQTNDLILTCLPDEAAFAQVISGEGGIVSVVRQGQLVIDLSTVSIKDKNSQKSMLNSKGAALMDGTVSGNPRMLKNRLATIFVSGEPIEFDQGRETLESITDRVSFVGAFGGGCYMKAISVLLVAVHTLAAAEAMELATLAGIPRQVVFDAIKGSNASSSMFEHRGRFMVDGNYPVATAILGRYIQKS